MKEEEAIKLLPTSKYHAYFNSCIRKPGYSGVGVLTKEKPIQVTKGIGIEEHDSEGRVITAEFPRFYLVNSYVPNSGIRLERLDYRISKWDVDFLAYLKTLDAKKPVVWCGDLNVAHHDIDLKNPKTNRKTAGFTEQERNSFTHMLSSAGLVDTFRTLHILHFDTFKYTFWTYKSATARENNVGWRLDYFIVSKNFIPHVADSTINPAIQGSDHCPVILTLK